MYQLRSGDLVFINLNRIQQTFTDEQMIRENFLNNNSPMSSSEQLDKKNDNLINPMCIVELNSCPVSKTAPLINIIGINVYYESTHLLDHNGNGFSRKCVCYGLPFVILINRDCRS